LDSEPSRVAISIEATSGVGHFIPVWSGNGSNLMHINVVKAKVNGHDLEPGDEVGLFDGQLCVGSAVVSSTLSPDNYLEIKASSAVEGIGNGFTAGNPVNYRFFDKSEEKEIIPVSAKYLNTDPLWIIDGRFYSNSSAFVELTTSIPINIALDLTTGWNIFSIGILPDNPDLKSLFQVLINNGLLVKIQDETGNSLEDMGVFGGWTNNIGNISPTEGYKIKVTRDCQLQIPGVLALMPFKIPLKTGWNIVGYPRQAEAEAKAVVQQLIDRGKLVKVQDETGNAIEDWGVFGGWQNGIGNFIPGEGYKIKVSANDTLTIYESYPKSSTIVPPAIATKHFRRVGEGNGLDHMNINLVNVPEGLLQEGDEVGVFDGDLCVGSMVIGIRYSVIGEKSEIRNKKSEITNISIPISASDGSGLNGFTEGNLFTVKIWKASVDKEYPVAPEIIKGSSTFLKHESTVASLKNLKIGGFENLKMDGAMGVRIFPNPTAGKIYISAGNISLTGSKVHVINTLGQVILNTVIDSDPGTISLSGNVSGVYFVKIIGDSWSKTERIILNYGLLKTP